MSNGSVLNVSGGHLLSVGTTVAVPFNTALNLDIDNGQGGSSVSITGTLTNGGNITLGPSNNPLSANTTLTVGRLSK